MKNPTIVIHDYVYILSSLTFYNYLEFRYVYNISVTCCVMLFKLDP